MRDVERTKSNILKAAGHLLAKKGFRALGVSAIAAEAQVGKPLLYRYFGGLPGLLAAYGNSHDFWPSSEELFGADLQSTKPMNYATYAAGFLVRFVNALRKRPHTRAVLAWGLIEKNDLTRHLDDVLRQRGHAAVAQLQERVQPPEGIDAPALNAILLAGIFYLTIRAGLTGEFAGLSLQSESDWKRVEAALQHIAKTAYRTEETAL